MHYESAGYSTPNHTHNRVVIHRARSTKSEEQQEQHINVCMYLLTD